jgi:integrase
MNAPWRWRTLPSLSAPLPEELAALRNSMAPRSEMGPAERAGQLLASAVFYGALLDRIWWGRWLKAALRGPKLVDDLMWLDLEPLDPEGTGPLSQPRRWFADPLTRALLARWHTRPAVTVEQNAEECLSAFFNWRGDSSKLIGLLAKHAEHYWQFRMPRVLVAHAAGKHRAVPLSAEDWPRLLGCEFDKSKLVTADDNPTPRRATRTWCKTQRRVLRRANNDIKYRRTGRLSAKKAAAAELEKLNPVLPAERLMNSWCIEALSFDRGKQQRGFMPNTTAAYLNLLTDHIVDESDDLIEMSADGLIDRFDERLAVIEKAGRRERTLKAVRALYGHLRRQRRDLPPFPLLLESHSSEQRASANLVSPAEFARALDRCRNADQQICIILGFRCGLRLGEALGLTAHDFYLDDEIFELTVVRNEHRLLKTPTSRRILPLNKLLQPAELALIKKHLLERVAALRVAPGENRLINERAAAVGHTSKYPSPKTALDKIVSDATSRPITHHHLRHSFASYLLATMLLPDDNPDPKVPEHLRSVISVERKVALADVLLGKQKLGQHSLHAVNAMLGHIVSETTLRSYAHLLDLSVLHYVGRPSVEPAVPKDQARILASRKYDPRPKHVVNESGPGAATKLGRSYVAPVAGQAPLPGSSELVKMSEWRGRRSKKSEKQFLIRKRWQPQSRDFAVKEGFRFEHPDWRHIAAIVGKSPSAETHELFGTNVEAWSGAADHIFGLRLRSGRARHKLDIESLLKSRRWAAYLDKHWRPEKRLTSIERRALFHAVETWDAARSEVRFRSRPLAVAWRNLLISLGFNDTELELSLKGMRFRARSSRELHTILADADDLPGTAATRGRRGSIRISFRGDGKSDRQVRSAGHFVMLLLAVREGYGAAAQS